MKVLFVSPFMRVPPDYGMAIRNYHLLNSLTAKHQVIFVAYETERQNDFVNWAKTRMTEFISLGPYPTPRVRSDNLGIIQKMIEPIPSFFLRARPQYQASAIRSTLARHPDTALIVLDTHLTAQAALHMELQIPCVTVFHDIMSNSCRRKFGMTGLRPYKLIYGLDWLKTWHYERRIIKRFRHVIAVSEPDAAWVSRQSSHATVFVSPNGVDTDFFRPQSKSHHPQNLLLVGSFAHSPNEDAFFYLVSEILPQIHAQYPEVTLTVVGLYPTEAMHAVARQEDRVRIIGSVPDVRPYYQMADVAVIPLRLGSGTKLKVLEAMSMGVPVVTTSVGAEGINAEPGLDLLVADEPSAIAACVLRLLRDPGEASEIACRARAVANRYDWTVLARDFERALVAIAGNAKAATSEV